MKKRNAFILSLEQELSYIVVLTMAMGAEYFITPEYVRSNLFRIDVIFLLMQGGTFISECLLYLKNRNDADIQEDIEIMDEVLNDTYESGHGKILFNIKSIITKGFTTIIVVRVILHIMGIEDI